MRTLAGSVVLKVVVVKEVLFRIECYSLFELVHVEVYCFFEEHEKEN